MKANANHRRHSIPCLDLCESSSRRGHADQRRQRMPLIPIIIDSELRRKNVVAESGRLHRLLRRFLEKKSSEKLANAREEKASEELQTESGNEVIIPNDLLFKIFILLPAESLFKIQFVCKNWFTLINTSILINSHALQSETVLISQKLVFLDSKIKCYFHFLDLDHGSYNFVESSVVELVAVRASCNGLILATTEQNKTLMLMNPVTRKNTALPSAETDNFTDGSFGIAFDNDSKTYKVVHLFRENSWCIGCEILSVCTRKWTRIEGPPPEFFLDITQIPVSIDVSLYWLPTKQSCDYFVSMNVQDEKFISKKLPVNNRAGMNRLLEIGGNLGFVNVAQMEDLLQVWILITDDRTTENWIKRYSISLSVNVRYQIPICCSRNGKEMVLETPARQLYAYNFDSGKMKLFRSSDGWTARIDKHYIPHRNTLASV